MSVDISGRANIAVPQPFADLFKLEAFGEQQTGAGVAQVVEPDVRQAVPFQKSPEPPGHHIGTKGCSIRPLADEIIAHIARPHENLVFPLFLPKTAEIVLHLGNQRQGAAGRASRGGEVLRRKKTPKKTKKKTRGCLGGLNAPLRWSSMPGLPSFCSKLVPFALETEKGQDLHLR